MNGETKRLLREQLEADHKENTYCSICDELIPEGEDVYEVCEYKVCTECMENCRRIV